MAKKTAASQADSEEQKVSAKRVLARLIAEVDESQFRELEQIAKLNKDLVKKISSLTSDEVRYIVDYYYMCQKSRIRCGNQINGFIKENEPHDLFLWLYKNALTLESQIKSAMDHWTDQHRLAGLLKNHVGGIGPVISAGIVANIDIHKAKTAGAIWRFAGLDPTCVWNKGEKRPWNASLKTLCWKLGQSFMKLSDKRKTKKSAWYGEQYRRQKAFYIEKNVSGGFKQNAEQVLRTKTFKKGEYAAIYKSGMLPDGHIDAMARRWVVKLFLSNLHELWCKLEGIPCPRPYTMAHQGHVHYLCMPGLLDLVD